MDSGKLGGYSNLQCFLDCTTPTVEIQFLSKHSFSAWQTPGAETVKYFNLGELWDQYYEWSAYGAGTRVRLPDGETLVQYYVPYLSAIQLYTNKPFTPSRFVHTAFRRDNISLKSLNGDHRNEYAKLSTSWNGGAWDARKSFGHLCFEFFEVCSPYGRVPFVDKVYELAHYFSGLTSLTSAELSPASWMSVAWYPIYQIPAKRNVKDLSTCFLTYHTISASFQDEKESETKSEENWNNVSLTPFGLATYKLEGSLWINPETGDSEKIASLFSAADSWLKQLGVHHHDFNYFSTHSI
uniref:Uncharacterized protein n=1 Tax=Ananas comosus var. bracteatus TaxID=296719 RepID=A0A6V7QM60_ANACO|nr:unnamed protein product [Ananas comosus var. bracteatus]